MNRCLGIPVCILALFLSTAALAADRLVLIVGNNQPVDGDLEPLQYADDDALMYANLFRGVSDDVRVLARADEGTKGLRPDSGQLEAPTRAAVLATMDALVAEAERRAGEGREVVLYFVFSGHGNYDEEGRGYLHLEDGRLTTRDLFYHLVTRAEGFHLVLLIDACNAGFLIQSRGGAERRPAGSPTLDLEQYGNVGLILSSSSAGEVREWGRYLAGIFSHQVRSGLTGIADVDGDRQVTFQELASFVAAANARVENPALRLTPYIRPPLSAPSLPVLDLEEARYGRWLRLWFEADARVTLLDEDLVRCADMNLDGGHAAEVAVVPKGRVLAVVDDRREYVIPADLKGTVELKTLEAREAQPLSARGVDRYYREHLFAEPYGRAFAMEYLGGRYAESLVFQRRTPRPWYENGWGWAATGTGVALLVASGALGFEALAEQDAARQTPWADERAAHNDRLSDLEGWTIGTAVAGAAALATGIVILAVDRPMEVHTVAPEVGPGITLLPTAGGALLETRF